MSLFNQKIFNALIFFIVCLFGVALPQHARCEDSHEVGIVNVSRLNLRLSPRADSPVIKALDKGAQVRVLEKQEGWLQVFYEGDIGYITNQEGYVTVYTVQAVEESHVSDLEKAKSKVKDFLRRIEKNESEIETFNQHEKEIVVKLQEMDLALNNARRQTAAISAELAKIKLDIQKNQKQAEDIEKEIDKGRGYAVARLVALYKLSRLGEMNLFATAESAYDFQKNKVAVEKILQRDQMMINDLAGKKQELSGLLVQLNEKKASQDLLEAKQKDAINKLSKEKSEREKILAELKTQKSNSMVTLSYLKEAAERLDQTVNQLTKETTTYENKGGKNFSSCQGLLKMPVVGKIISKYGTYTEEQSGAKNFRNGIEIQAARGAPVAAVFAGQIAFADWLKGYGNVIIITHGDSYYTVYAHADDLFRAKGDNVQAGDVIATVGDTGSMTGPTLYFEIRHHGSTEDPMKWLGKG